MHYLYHYYPIMFGICCALYTVDLNFHNRKDYAGGLFRQAFPKNGRFLHDK